jgi:hypothetical protein
MNLSMVVAVDFWVGGWTREKFLARHPQNEDVDLAIRSKSGGEQVAAEISFVSLLKMIAEANCHHAARRACDLPLPGTPIVRW